MPIVTGFEIYYYNISDDHNNSKTFENSILSFFVSLFLMFFLIFLVRCCVSLSKNYNRKYKFRKLHNLNVNRDGINSECPICFEPVTDKFVLECNHSFNKKCLQKWVETSIENNSFRCPLCNIDYNIN